MLPFPLRPLFTVWRRKTALPIHSGNCTERHSHSSQQAARPWEKAQPDSKQQASENFYVFAFVEGFGAASAFWFFVLFN